MQPLRSFVVQDRRCTEQGVDMMLKTQTRSENIVTMYYPGVKVSFFV